MFILMYVPTYLPIYLSIYLPIYLSIYFSIYLSIYLKCYTSSNQCWQIAKSLLMAVRKTFYCSVFYPIQLSYTYLFIFTIQSQGNTFRWPGDIFLIGNSFFTGDNFSSCDCFLTSAGFKSRLSAASTSYSSPPNLT